MKATTYQSFTKATGQEQERLEKLTRMYLRGEMDLQHYQRSVRNLRVLDLREMASHVKLPVVVEK